jgi:hypothetical protein
MFAPSISRRVRRPRSACAQTRNGGLSSAAKKRRIGRLRQGYGGQGNRPSLRANSGGNFALIFPKNNMMVFSSYDP